MDLLSTPSLVESPFIIVRIGNYTFGNYSRSGSGGGFASSAKVTYPNYMNSIEITKVNGMVNTYTIKMVYGIAKGDDPNLLEKVFSSVSKTRKITISYGDWNSPSYIYREEEAIITKVTSNIDISGAKISYTISCTSTSLALQAGSYNFPAYDSKKPSDVIKELLSNKSYGLTDIFYGMSSNDVVQRLGLIAGDDKAVKLEAKQKTNVLDYLNYLVNSMSSSSNTGNSALNDSRYCLTVVDTVSGNVDGPYFKVTKVPRAVSSETLNALNAFEINVGYSDADHPTENLIVSFNLNNNEAWSILYDYSGSLNQSNYVYKLDNKGQLETVYSPNITTSKSLQYTTSAEKSWWTNVTQFPVSATLTIKGLIRPAILMSYVRINVWFYGAMHDSSGLYFITKQQDLLDSTGYRTMLTLTRIPEYSTTGGSVQGILGGLQNDIGISSYHIDAPASGGGGGFDGGGRHFEENTSNVTKETTLNNTGGGGQTSGSSGAGRDLNNNSVGTPSDNTGGGGTTRGGGAGRR